jgi:hypothetical protein
VYMCLCVYECVRVFADGEDDARVHALSLECVCVCVCVCVSAPLSISPSLCVRIHYVCMQMWTMKLECMH